jgi:hypothetical protein
MISGEATSTTILPVDLASASYLLQPHQATLLLHGNQGLTLAVPMTHALIKSIVHEGAKILSSFKPVAPSTTTKQ